MSRSEKRWAKAGAQYGRYLGEKYYDLSLPGNNTYDVEFFDLYFLSLYRVKDCIIPVEDLPFYEVETNVFDCFR